MSRILIPLNYSDPTISVEAYKLMIEDRSKQSGGIRKDIQIAYDRQKHYDDASLSELIFKEGGMIFLRVRTKRSTLSLGGKYKK